MAQPSGVEIDSGAFFNRLLASLSPAPDGEPTHVSAIERYAQTFGYHNALGFAAQEFSAAITGVPPADPQYEAAQPHFDEILLRREDPVLRDADCGCDRRTLIRDMQHTSQLLALGGAVGGAINALGSMGIGAASTAFTQGLLGGYMPGMSAVPASRLYTAKTLPLAFPVPWRKVKKLLDTPTLWDDALTHMTDVREFNRACTTMGWTSEIEEDVNLGLPVFQNDPFFQFRTRLRADAQGFDALGSGYRLVNFKLKQSFDGKLYRDDGFIQAGGNELFTVVRIKKTLGFQTHDYDSVAPFIPLCMYLLLTFWVLEMAIEAATS